MIITSLLPLLSRYSLGFDLVAGPDDTVTLTIIPRKAEGAKHSPEGVEIRPISITATAAEIDAELVKGADGALGQLITTRKALGDQIAEQRKVADDAKTAASAKTKPAAAAAKAGRALPPVKSDEPPRPPQPAGTEDAAKPGEPASLW